MNKRYANIRGEEPERGSTRKTGRQTRETDKMRTVREVAAIGPGGMDALQRAARR